MTFVSHFRLLYMPGRYGARDRFRIVYTTHLDQVSPSIPGPGPATEGRGDIAHSMARKPFELLGWAMLRMGLTMIKKRL